MSRALKTVTDGLKRRAQEREKAKEEKRASLLSEIENVQEQMRQLQPVAFTMAVAESAIVTGYNSLLNRKEYSNKKLEELKDVKSAGRFDGVLYLILEMFLGVFIIYNLLYRMMGEDFFREVTFTFGLDIDPLYISLIFEAIVIVMFSLGMRLYVTSRFDEKKKEVVKLFMKVASVVFICAYIGFVYLSNK